MPTDDRERQFERALARHLRNASPDSVCPDAETLAACHERTLSLEEMARWKEHIAGCTRCQESLALVEQSEVVHTEEGEHQNVLLSEEDMVLPGSTRAAGASVRHEDEVLKASHRAEAAPIRKATARPNWRWLVPVGALAASVIVWIEVREILTQRSHPMESVQVAQNRQASPQTPPASYGAADQLRKEESSGQRMDEGIHSQKKIAPSSPKMVRPQGTGSAGNAISPPPPVREAATAKQRDLEISGTAKVSPLQSPPPTPPSSDAAKSQVMVTAAPPAAHPAAVGGAVAGGVFANRPVEEKNKAPVPSMSQTVTAQAEAVPRDTTSTEMAIRGRNLADLVQLAGGDRRYIVAPGEKHAWRVGEAGKIERSTDRGKTWKLQKSGLTADLTAGSATSDKVCWVVGKAGTVLLTTDGGKHWKQISSPITEDLGGIHALDSLHASIWDVPNRKSFETSDGGATWKRTSGK